MDGFPRLDLFSPREKRALALFCVCALAVAAGALVYVHPLPSPKANPAPAATSRPRVPPEFIDISAASADIAYANANGFPGSSTPYATVDGGKTWRPLVLPAGVTSATAIALSGSSVALLRPNAFESGSAWVSHDAGKHWRAVLPPNTANRQGGFQFVNGTTRAIYSSSGPAGTFMFESVDEGTTWRPVLQMAPGESLTPEIPAAGNLNFWFAGNGYWAVSTAPGGGPLRVARSADGGQTWQAVALPALPEGVNARLSFSLPQFGSGHWAWVWAYPVQANGSTEVSAQPHLISTSADGGLTWSPVRAIDHFPLFTVPGSNDGWAVDGSTIYRSQDLGLTWTSFNARLPSGERLMEVTRVTPQVAWNVFGNFQGGLVSEEPDRTHLLRTTDGGRHWSEVKLPGS